jgi:uncharacterized oligopeptide transporter (OPT) family protein
MHTTGAAAMAKARSLFYGAIVGGVITLWRDGLPIIASWLPDASSVGERLKTIAIPTTLPLFPGEQGAALLKRTSLGFEGSMIMIAAGAIMGIRVGISLLVGAVVYYGIIGPQLIDRNIITSTGYGKTGINSWTVWPATAMMVTSGLLSFALRWRTVVQAFQGLAGIFGRSGDSDDPLEHIEVPGSWFVMGTLVAGAACVVLGHLLFDITWWMGVLAVMLTFVLSIVAARATGETSVTPISAMGKITQLLYGVVAPSNITTNLMTASITAGASAHSADLLTDLKCGYLLGGNARKQTISQLFGVLAGTLVSVPVYTLVANPEKLGSDQLPAPAAKVWAGVAEMMANGIEALPEGAPLAAIVGGLLGIVITLAEEFAPEKYRAWIPSATGLGIAGIIPAFNAVSMFLGALAAWLLAKAKPQLAETYTVPVSSGLIAGESLMGVAVIVAAEAPGLYQSLS